jgi:ferredoxin
MVPLPMNGATMVNIGETENTLSSPAGGDATATCIHCSRQHCIHGISVAGGIVAESSLCPTDAIHSGSHGGVVIDATACVKCGLCVHTCPGGGIAVPTAARVAQVLKPDPDFQLGDETAYFAGLNQRTTSLNVEAMARDLSDGFRSTKQSHYYPAVAQLFNLVGVQAHLSNPGDTNFRFDVLLRWDGNMAPVEVKSPLECIDINTKSLRQAVENFAVAKNRFLAQSGELLAGTLVVAHEEPAKRSSVAELCADYEQSLGVRISLLTFERLALSAMRVHYGQSDQETEIQLLLGHLDGAGAA